jgi:hypothetical protein
MAVVCVFLNQGALSYPTSAGGHVPAFLTRSQDTPFRCPDTDITS